MLTLGDMLVRLAAALVLGAIVGVERELAGKEAGVRTNIMVAAGAALFTIAGLTLPYVVAVSPEHVAEVIARNSGFLAVIANVVVGIGFLGAGLIVKQGIHVRSVTTAAAIWFVAAVGVLAGMGLLAFAALATVGVTILLEILGRVNIERIGGEEHDHEERGE